MRGAVHPLPPHTIVWTETDVLLTVRQLEYGRFVKIVINCNFLNDQLVYHDLCRVIVSQDEDTDDESDDEYEANEETALESYTTPLDEDTCSIDEYVVFKEVLQSMYQKIFLIWKRKHGISQYQCLWQ